MISQAGPPYPQLQWESHCYCVPQPLITFSNDSAKQQGIPTACHQPTLKCACGGWRGGEGVKTASRNRTAAILGSSCPVALRMAAISRSNTFRSSLKWSADTEGPQTTRFLVFFPPLLLPLKVVSKLFALWIAQGFENVKPGSGQGNLCLCLYKVASKIGAIEERCHALKFCGAMTDQGEQCRLSG